MSISFACPSCEFVFKTGDEFAGRKAKCPKCSAPIVVPAASAVAAEPAAPAQHEDHHDDHDDEDPIYSEEIEIITCEDDGGVE